MSSSSSLQELLPELHRILRQRTDLEGRIRRAPKAKNMVQDSLNQATTHFDEAKALQKKTRMSADEKQLHLRQREAKIEQLKSKLNTAESNKEYQILKDQIAAEQQANEVLSDEILELLERIDQIQTDINSYQQKIDTNRKRLVEVETELNTVMAGLQSELDRVNQLLREAETRLPGEVRGDYSRLVMTKGEEALAKLEEGCCGNCNQTLTTQMSNNLMLGKLTTCPSCGAILYLAERSVIR